MNKELEDMTLEELWELFPVVLKPYDPVYRIWFSDEVKHLNKHLGRDAIKRINHIGSTAVPGIISKPTVDILLEIERSLDIEMVTEALKRAGYTMMSQQKSPFFCRSFNKGYTKQGLGERVYHLHLRYNADWHELYFRDYLLEHPDVAKTYGDMKSVLANKHKHNRDAYTEAKSEFISSYTNEARGLYRGRYRVGHV